MPAQTAALTKRMHFFFGMVFFFSGLASLIYQVVWQRMLTLYYGVGSLSITLIVSVYMLGLGFGALLGGAVSERRGNKLALYLAIELALGLFGLGSPFFLDFLGHSTAGSPYWLSLLWIFLFLSFPTLLMGMTLPVIVKAFNRDTENFKDSVSFLYFINTLGAAFGALLASFGLISFAGLDAGIYTAVSINFGLAALMYFIGRNFQDSELPASFSPERMEDGSGRAIYFWIFVTGFLGIGYEIIGCRVVEVLVKASPYAFSIVLFVYLCGIALGSFAMNRFFKKVPQAGRQNLFFLLQGGIGLYALASILVYYQLTRHTPFRVFTESSFWEVLHPPVVFPNTGSLRADLFVFFDAFLWPFFFLFIPAVGMGASFPVVSRLALFRRDLEGKTVGTVFFVLSLGNVLGGLLTGFLILPAFGTERALLAFGLIGLGMGLKAIPLPLKAAAACAMAALLFPFFPVRGELYKAMHVAPGKDFEVYLEEGLEGVVATYQNKDQVKNYINGLGHGGRPGYEFYNETIETVRFAGKAEDVLIIGFGTGSILETISRLESVKKITLVELNGTLLRNLEKMEIFRKILSDPRIHLVVDDGRRFLARNHARFDLILMDPLRTTTAYSNNLYSRQFFERAGRTLQAGGVFMVWLDEYRVMPATLASAFKHLRLYNYFAIASNNTFTENNERAERLLASFSEQDQKGMLGKGKRYVGDENYVREKMRGYPINEDWKPVCEYYLGLKARRLLSK